MSETPIYRAWQRTCPACASLRIRRTCWRAFPRHWTTARRNECRNCGHVWFEERGPGRPGYLVLQPLQTTPAREEVT